MRNGLVRLCALLLANGVLLCSYSGELRAQAQAKLPASWQQMSADDFAAAIRVLRDDETFKFLSVGEEQAAKAKGRDLFLQIDLLNTEMSFRTIGMLHWLVKYDLEPAVDERTRTALLTRREDWTGRSYEEGRAKIEMMMHYKFDDSVIIAEARRWVQAGGTIEQVPVEDLSIDLVRMIFSDAQLVNSSFDVEWEGSITTQVTGAHQFLISPINVNTGVTQFPVKFSMTVSIGGQVIIDSSPTKEKSPIVWFDPSEWISRSNVVSLTAGQAVPLRVTAKVDSLKALPSATLHAMLFWKAPGKQREEIVAPANLTLPDGSGQGLKATYRWNTNGQPQTLTRTDPNIDFAWTNRPILLAKDSTIGNQSANTVWRALTANSFVAEMIGPPTKLHPFLKEPDDSAAGMTTSRRSEFLDILLKNPALLDPMDTKRAVRFYEPFRVGVPDKALDAFGTWAIRNPDLIPDFSTDRVFNGDQRYAFSRMAIFVTQQLPGQAELLQANYLQLADGRCSLPVAYTLAHSYLGRKKYSEWLGILDAKLADKAVTGDARVNWLLARANAQELDPNSSSHYPHYYPVPFHNALGGLNYLDDALKAATTPAVKVRVAHEIISRLAWQGDFKQAKSVLQSLGTSLPEDQQAIVTDRLQQLDRFAAEAQQLNKDRPNIARQLHLKELKLRRDQAIKLGDSALTTRYDGLIDAATTNP
ncbi:PA14 domain-containing protein [Schlesneria paludicola]|uniref:PA14 domain-containing protein n=1 Tax=Schlesneria paludicola TaxID=360056 RepID=UPI00029AEC88|nr:PA14 domain-containing protein [Schlesneria paludicola]